MPYKAMRGNSHSLKALAQGPMTAKPHHGNTYTSVRDRNVDRVVHNSCG